MDPLENVWGFKFWGMSQIVLSLNPYNDLGVHFHKIAFIYLEFPQSHKFKFVWFELYD